jgi:enterochelin esterase-like enzyme
MNKQTRFATIDLSDARYEWENLRFLTFKSPVLQGRGDVTLFIPPDSETLTGLPLVVLLHGVYGSHWNWALKGGAHRTAMAMIAADEIPPMILVMPSDGLWGDGSGYIPHTSTDYAAWIAEDVIDCVQEALPQADEQSPIFISGLSMGGFGALYLGARFPARFAGISAHSSITHYDQFEIFSRQPMSTYQLANEEDKSVLHWILKHRDQLPPLRFDCGSTDLLIEYNRELHQALLEHDVDHHYEEFEGGHSWAYWSEHLVDSLRFFGGILTSD